MTWGEWCDSEYNIDGYCLLDNSIYNSSGEEFIHGALKDRVIQHGEAYNYYQMPEDEF